ncbi:MAG: VOC family protein [Candidatus Latescibacterota bacterium]|nr:VOC family protein [Candidatus Latescibacterota bacterium]
MAVFLHTRIRVSDLDRSIDWYCTHFGFEVKNRTDKSPAGNFIAHLELPGNDHTLELTWSEEYKVNVPEDLMHFAVGVPNIIQFCDRLEKAGIKIWPGGWRQEFPAGSKMAFVDDPDGYEVEILERS